MNGGDLKWLGTNGSGRLWCWLGISEWRTTSGCGALSFLLVTQPVTFFWDWLCVCSFAATVWVHSLSLRHLWADSGGIAQAAASFVVNSVHRCDLKREYQTWRLQHEAADLYFDNLTKWFRSHTRGFPRRKDELCRGSKGREGVTSVWRENNEWRRKNFCGFFEQVWRP